MNKQNKSNPLPTDNSLLNNFVKLTRSYFGTDAPQYIARFMKAHLQKPPELVTRDDLISLIDWIKLLANYLGDDEEIVEKYMTELHDLITADARSSSDSKESE